MIDLAQFCTDHDNSYGETFRQLFSFGAHSYAVKNLHITVRVDRVVGVRDLAGREIGVGEQILKMFANIEARHFAPLPAFETIPGKPIPEMKCRTCEGKGGQRNCEACEGQGEGECPTCGGEQACKACDGDGYFAVEKGSENATDCEECAGSGVFIEAGNEPDVANLPAHTLNAEYLALIGGLPNAQFALDGKAMDPVPFRFDGGYGLLMPMRRPQAREVSPSELAERVGAA